MVAHCFSPYWFESTGMTRRYAARWAASPPGGGVALSTARGNARPAIAADVLRREEGGIRHAGDVGADDMAYGEPMERASRHVG